MLKWSQKDWEIRKGSKNMFLYSRTSLNYYSLADAEWLSEYDKKQQQKAEEEEKLAMRLSG